MPKDLAIRKALIVEDEPLISMMIEEMLQEQGFEVHVAGTVAEAASIVESSKFDAAILDVLLRGETAVPVAGALRRRGVPFLVSSGSLGRDLPMEMRDAPTLTKPFSGDELKSAMMDLLG